MSREEFRTDLRSIRGALVDMTIAAADAIGKSTAALLRGDLASAAQVEEINRRLEMSRRTVDRRTYQLLALQQPVAGDLRELVSAIRISADIHRMGSLAHHIGKVAARSHPGPAVPNELFATFERMGLVAARLAEGAGVTLDTCDAQDAARLAVDDDAMDGLRSALFRELLSDWPYGVEAAINVALVGRYYERFADHAVAIAESVVYLVTGAFPDEHSQPCSRGT